MKQRTRWSATKVIVTAVAVFLLSVSVAPSAGTRQLTFEERVTAQRAIEQVYWDHRSWPEQNRGAKPSLGEVLPETAIRAKTRSYLSRSDALGKAGRPITQQQLSDEMARMVASSNAPGVLRELFAALGNDSVVIAETLVRQKLVDRPASLAQSTSGAALAVGCNEDVWIPTSTAPGVPTARRDHMAVWTGSEMIIWGGTNVSAAGGSLLDSGGRYDPATDTWTPTSTVGVPEPRAGQFAVWTGTEMIVWGGQRWDGVYIFFNTGGRYNPSLDSWQATSTVGAPAGRSINTAVWTGLQMIVWGGSNGVPLNTGGRYDPSTDLWLPTSTVGTPEARYFHTAVWTGTEMVVWGGTPASDVYLNSGGRYNPSSDSWIPTAMVAAPLARHHHVAVWTGTEMIVWGGDAYAGPHASTILNSGGRYNPLAETWLPTSLLNAPKARTPYTAAVWSGNAMFVWGGAASTLVNTGGRYVPTSDTWIPTATVGAPDARYAHTTVWTGTQMIVWGGEGACSACYLNSGGRYCSSCDDGNPCTSDSYNPATGCIHAPVADTPCCAGGVPVHCDDGDVCTTDSCDPATGCTHVNNTAPCSDGNACTVNDACSAGSCVGGGPRNCNDANPCTTDSCDPSSGCVHTTVPGALCCTGGIPTDCDDGNPCTTDACDPSTGNCIHTRVTQGTPCDDGNPCTIADTCEPNGCTGAWRFCDDFSRCTDDSCDPATGCVFTPVVCDDHNACTADYCSSYSGCQRYYLCEDSNWCTQDSCNPATGCVHTDITCDDGNPCTWDVCNPLSGCQHAPNTCSTNFPCVHGACNPGTGQCVYDTLPLVCDDHNACTTDVCDVARGCLNTLAANGTVCNDNDLCTSGETCQAGTCTPGFNGLNHPNPKSAGYYRKLCEKRAQGHLPYQGDQLTDADAVCVGQLTATFAGISTVDDICNVIYIDQHGGRHHGGPGDGPNGKDCEKGEDELIATALNICRARVCEEQNLDSRCHGNTSTTVAQSFADADTILDDAGRTKDTCKDARCELREINNGQALENNSLVLSLDNNNVRLTWLSPVLDDGSGEPDAYEIRRRPLGSNDPFVKIGTVKALTFLDGDTGTAPWEYEIIAVTP